MLASTQIICPDHISLSQIPFPRRVYITAGEIKHGVSPISSHISSHISPMDRILKKRSRPST